MQVVLVLARPHHHDQPLAREAHHVRARQIAPCVECAVGGERAGGGWAARVAAHGRGRCAT
eukprot:4281508-Prymnesium_polylepis.1